MKKIFLLLVLKKFVVLFVLCAMLLQQQQTFAQALPVAPAANFVMNRAVGGVITRVAVSRGFAANDPRIVATMVGASSQLTALNVVSGVAGVALAIAGAPVWLTVVGSLGVLAIGAAIIAGTSSMSIEETAAGTKIRVDNSGSPAQPGYEPAPPQAVFQKYIDYGYEIYREPNCFSSQPCYAFPLLPTGDVPIKWTPPSNSEGGPIAIVFWSLPSFFSKWTPWRVPPNTPFNGNWYPGTYNSAGTFTPDLSTATWTVGPDWEMASNGQRRLIGQLKLTTPGYADIASGFVSSDYPLIFSPTIGPSWHGNLDSALSALSPEAKAQPVSDAVIAKIVDTAWKNAASQPNYQGLPYSVTQPVTASDVATWRAENPTSVPTLGDLLMPANNPGTSTVPISPTVVASPVTGPMPTPPPTTSNDVNVINTPNVNVVNNVKVDLGPDPGVGAPNLESTPTATSILQPLLNLMPDLKNYAVPTHSSECPKASISIPLFDKTFSLDAHCTLAEDLRTPIYTMMVMVWTLSSVFIILAA
jgi:hypothetical protein